MLTADPAEFSGLRSALSGRVVTDADAEWDAARQAFNLAVDQRPAAVAFPADDDDVVTAVRFAAEHGLRVAAQRTGHNAGPLGLLQATVLLRTDALTGVDIDVQRQQARVQAGATWGDVVPRASNAHLAALHGSTPSVGVVGYSLGGGMGWYARRWGLAAHSVTAVELVTADGSRLRADADHEPELFWALRGGGGNFGVVTALEFRLYPLSAAYAGAVFYPWERSAEVLHTWHALLAELPDTVTSCARIMQFPPFPEVPAPLRGQSLAIVEAVCVEGEHEGADLMRPLRELGPVLDTFAMVEPVRLVELHMDPPEPMPVLSAHLLLDALPPSAIDDLVAVAGPGSDSPLVSVELRHTGGAVAREQPHHGAAGALPGTLSLFAVGIPAHPAATIAVAEQLEQVTAVLDPYEVGLALNHVEQPVPTRGVYPPQTYRRLQAVKAAYDPHELFQANHPVPPTGR